MLQGFAEYADSVCALRKGERLVGVGTGAVEGSLGQESNESIKTEDIVNVPEWNAIRKCKDAICTAATGHQ